MKPAKLTDPIDDQVAELEEILVFVGDTDARLSKKVKSDLLKLKAGHTAEKTAAHLMDKQFQEATKSIFLHDLRLEVDGDVSQIDHVQLNRFGFVTLYETKSFSTGIKIDDDGVFWRWDGYGKKYVEIPSPILQSKRHEATLKTVLKSVGYEALHFSHYVLVDYKAKLIKPKDNKFNNVCRPDRLIEVLDKESERVSGFDEFKATFKGLGRLVSGNVLTSDELVHIGERLARHHVPLQMDVWSKYGLQKPVTAEDIDTPEARDIEQPKVSKAKEVHRISSSKAAVRLKLTTQEFLQKAAAAGLVALEGEAYVATDKAMKMGIENKVFRNIPYVSWPIAIIERLEKKAS